MREVAQASAEMALAEARAILEETEADSLVPVMLWQLSEWLGRRLEPQVALADALAGLCDAPDAAAYLAELQPR